MEHNYSSIEFALGEEISRFRVTGDDVLLGNSAAYTNNHADIIETIGKCNLGERKVFTPLSYAGKDFYVDRIIEIGKSRLGENFCPMTDFMDREAYFQFLSRCSFVLFPHHRQQAGGVLRVLLYGGATVFLFKDNPVWDFYSRLGVKLISLEALFADPDFDSHRLSVSESTNNRQIVLDHFSNENVTDRARIMFETFMNNSANDSGQRTY